MPHQRWNLAIDRQFRQLLERDLLVRKLTYLAIVLLSLVIVLMMMLFAATRANAIECQDRPDNRGQWTWRLIDNHRCWYRGRHVMAKKNLHWPDAQPKPIITDEVKANRAEAMPLDANGSELTSYLEVIEKPQPDDRCCWPPLDERSFKSRWQDIPAQWLIRQ